MNISLENKVPLGAGAGSGSRLATAKAFAESGAAVVLTDSNEKSVRAAATNSSPGAARRFPSPAMLGSRAGRGRRREPGHVRRIDAAFNGAASQNILAETADTTRKDYDRVMGINLRGVWSCMKFEFQQMRKQGSGAIVNCSSLGGLVGGAERGIYHASERGVLGFTKSAALEYAPRGIRVNAVCPGLIWTPMVDQMVAGGQGEAMKAMEKSVPMQRVGRPRRLRMPFCGSAVRQPAM